jgi:hypothetical protein
MATSVGFWIEKIRPMKIILGNIQVAKNILALQGEGEGECRIRCVSM